MPKRNAFDFSVVNFITLALTCSAATQLGGADIPGRHRARDPSWTGVYAALASGHARTRSCAHGEFEAAVALLEDALERSQKIHSQYLTSLTGAQLGETLAPRDPKRAFDVAETALGVARASGHRAIEAELLRVKAASLVNVDCDAAEAAAREGLELAEKLGLGPEQGHGLRTLGDIMVAKGEAMKAERLREPYRFATRTRRDKNSPASPAPLRRSRSGLRSRSKLNSLGFIIVIFRQEANGSPRPPRSRTSSLAGVGPAKIV